MHWISLTSMSIDYENPWIYNGKAFESSDIGDALVLSTAYHVMRLNVNISEENTFLEVPNTKGKKRKVKSESDWKNTMDRAQNLKKILNDWVNKILVELSYHYIQHLGNKLRRNKTTLRQKEFLPSHLATEHRILQQ